MFEGGDAVCLAGLRSDLLQEVEVKTCLATPFTVDLPSLPNKKEQEFLIEVSESAHFHDMLTPDCAMQVRRLGCSAAPTNFGRHEHAMRARRVLGRRSSGLVDERSPNVLRS